MTSMASARSPLLVIPRVHRATHQIGLRVGAWSDLALTQAEAHILDHLATAGSCTVGALHRAFAHRRSTLTSVLDRLAERKLIQRDTSPHDRRTFMVRLTPGGRAVAARVHDSLQHIESRALARVSARDLRGFVAVLDEMERALSTGVDARAGARHRPAAR